jgi:hypothetical protein
VGERKDDLSPMESPMLCRFVAGERNDKDIHMNFEAHKVAMQREIGKANDSGVNAHESLDRQTDRCAIFAK